MVLSHNTELEKSRLSNNYLGTIGIIKIAKGLQNVKKLTEFNINNNGVGEQAAEYNAGALSHNINLQKLYLDNFKVVGIIEITRALQNTSTLTDFSISSNKIGKAAADDIAAVLLHNTNLQELQIHDNSLKTAGIIKITKALQDISTLTVFNISKNSVGDKAADDIAAVLSHNTKLQNLCLDNNHFKAAGMIEIVKGLQNISTLTVFGISNNYVGDKATDDIAMVLYHNTNLQKLYLDKKNFKTGGMIKIAKANVP